MMWQGAPGGAVSVVTTVYSGVSGFPNAGQQSYSAANTNIYGGPQQYVGQPNASPMQKTPVYDSSYGSYGQSYHHGQQNDYANSAPQAAALNAAQVAAAAVATATATATAMAFDQSQFQNYGPPQNGYGQQPQYAGMVQNQYHNPRLIPANAMGRPQMPPNYGAPTVRARSVAPAAAYQKLTMGNSAGVQMEQQLQYNPQQQPVGSRQMTAMAYSTQMMPTTGPAGAQVPYRQRPPNNVAIRSPQYGMISQTPYANVGYGQQTPAPNQQMMSAGYPVINFCTFSLMQEQIFFSISVQNVFQFELNGRRLSRQSNPADDPRQRRWYGFASGISCRHDACQ